MAFSFIPQRGFLLFWTGKVSGVLEVDKKINYKEKVLTYYRLFEGFFEMVSAPINLLGDEQEGRGEKISNLVLPPLQRIKKQELEIKEAQIAFERKYPTDKNGNIKTGTDFEYVRFSEYQYEKADLQDGEKISLLSYSGFGRPCSLDTMYYVQLIGMVESTGDTVRVLTPCQHFDYEKTPTKCYFQSSVPPEVLDIITTNNSFVVFNKNHTALERKNFKTAFGTIQFED